MSDILDQILGIIRSVKDDGEKLAQILSFLESEIAEEEKFEEIEVPEKFKSIIPEIAGNLDIDMVCFLNPETLEIDFLPREMLNEVDLFGDTPDNVRKFLDEIHGWESVKMLDWDTIIEFSLQHPMRDTVSWNLLPRGSRAMTN